MPILDKIEIGKRLEAFRLGLNMKPKEFAVKAKIDQSHYSKIEHGNLPITDNVWDKLESVYSLDKTYILLGIAVPETGVNSVWQDRLRRIKPEDISEALQVLAGVASKIGHKKVEVFSKEPDTSNNRKLRGELRKGSGYKKGKSGTGS